MSQFFATIGRLRWIQRWSLKRNTLPENVMEHSWEVAVIAHLLGVINCQVYQGGLNPDRLAVLAMYHDCAEAITGDLPTPVKYYSKDIQLAYRAIEDDAEKSLSAMLPQALQGVMTQYLQESGGDRLERRYVKAADSLSAYMKARAEVDNGNQEYRQTLVDLQRKLLAYDLSEVEYFLEVFAVNQSDAASHKQPINTANIPQGGFLVAGQS